MQCPVWRYLLNPSQPPTSGSHQHTKPDPFIPRAGGGGARTERVNLAVCPGQLHETWSMLDPLREPAEIKRSRLHLSSYPSRKFRQGNTIHASGYRGSFIMATNNLGSHNNVQINASSLQVSLATPSALEEAPSKMLSTRFPVFKLISIHKHSSRLCLK